MRKKYTVLVALLFSGVVLAMGWPVDAYYDGSSEGTNVGNIMNAGYGAIMKVGKAYKFEFKDGVTAYFMRTSAWGTHQWAQVSREKYEEVKGEDYSGSDSDGGGSGTGGDGGYVDVDEFLDDHGLAYEGNEWGSDWEMLQQELINSGVCWAYFWSDGTTTLSCQL